MKIFKTLTERERLTMHKGFYWGFSAGLSIGVLLPWLAWGQL